MNLPYELYHAFPNRFVRCKKGTDAIHAISLILYPGPSLGREDQAPTLIFKESLHGGLRISDAQNAISGQTLDINNGAMMP